MAIEMREGWLNFPSTTGRKQSENATVNFGSRVLSTHALQESDSKMNYRYFISKLLVLLSVASLSLTAQAANEFAHGGLNPACFSYSAVAMAAYDRSIQNNLYRKTHERVYHSTGAVGGILLYGPVHPWDMYGDGVSFAATFIDPDGPGTNAQVVAQLRFVGPSGIRIIKTLDSNAYAYATKEVQTMSAPVHYSEISDDEGYYVVRMYINRKDTTLSPVAFGYNLCSAIF